MTQIFSQVLKYFQKKEKNKERRKNKKKKKRKKNPTHPPVKSRHQPWVLCGLFLSFLLASLKTQLIALVWIASYQHRELAKPWSQQQSHLGRCQSKRQSPATCTHCWHCAVCVQDAWPERQCLRPPSLWCASDLGFYLFLFGALQPGELYLNALYLEKCEVVHRELAVKWTEDEKRACTIGKLHMCKHGSYFLYFWITLAHMSVCVSMSSCIQCMGCVPAGFCQMDPFLMSALLLTTGRAPLAASPKPFDHTISIGFTRCS